MNRNRLDDLSWAMSQVYSGVEDRIMINLAKYFPMVHAKGQMTGSFEYQARMLGKMGSVTKETVAIIAGSLGNADEALRRSLTTAILDALQGEEGKLIAAAKKGLLTGIPGEIAPSMMQAFRTYYQQSADKLNLVNTVMLESAQAAYTAAVTDAAARIQQIQGALNLGAGEVITGVSAWNQAMRTTVQSMVKAGITGYIDHAGRRWSPEAYVAMDIRTTMFNTSRAAVWERNQQYNNDLYQVSSHMGARPLCYPWQGKVLSTSGRTGTTTDLDGNEVVIHSEAEVESFRYGGGLFGVNCGHYPMVFIPGFSKLKDVPQDEEENAKTYAESQQQRALERKLREEKRDLEVMKAQGVGEEAIKAQRERVRRASGDLDTFCEETGRHRDRTREYTPIDAKWPDPSTYDPTKFPTAEREKIREWFANGGRDNPPPLQGGMHLGPDDIPPAAQTQIPITPQQITQNAMPQATSGEPPKGGIKPMTPEQSEAVENYVSGDNMYINQVLRGRAGDATQEDLQLIRLIDDALDVPLGERQTLYRSVDAKAVFGGVSAIDYENMRGALVYNDNYGKKQVQSIIDRVQGKTIMEKGYMSTTKEFEIASEWGGFTGSEKPIVIQFDVPAGTHGRDLAIFDVEGEEQREVLLARGQKYKVREIGAKDGNIMVYADIVVA